MWSVLRETELGKIYLLNRDNQTAILKEIGVVCRKQAFLSHQDTVNVESLYSGR